MCDLAGLTNPQRIRLLKGNLHPTFVSGKIVLTAGVDALEAAAKNQFLSAVRDFTASPATMTHTTNMTSDGSS